MTWHYIITSSGWAGSELGIRHYSFVSLSSGRESGRKEKGRGREGRRGGGEGKHVWVPGVLSPGSPIPARGHGTPT